eukprot:UN13634
MLQLKIKSVMKSNLFLDLSQYKCFTIEYPASLSDSSSKSQIHAIDKQQYERCIHGKLRSSSSRPNSAASGMSYVNEAECGEEREISLLSK